MSDNTSVGEALPILMAKVRDKILPVYDSIPTGVFAATMMRQSLDKAAKALAGGDVLEILESYQELSDFKL